MRTLRLCEKMLCFGSGLSRRHGNSRGLSGLGNYRIPDRIFPASGTGGSDNHKDVGDVEVFEGRKLGGREGESHALRFTKGPALSWSLPKHEGNSFPQTPFGSIPLHAIKQRDGRRLQEFYVVSHVPIRKNIRDQFNTSDAVSDRDILCMGKYNSAMSYACRTCHH